MRPAETRRYTISEGFAVDSNSRLRIATRIHFALRRHIGEDIDVASLLHDESQAREALWVCDASGDADLIALAQRFRQAQRETDAVDAGHAAVPQDLIWARDTSGFGLSRPLDLGEPATPAPADDGWFKPLGWLRGERSRRQG
jgi:hypothetical protein